MINLKLNPCTYIKPQNTRFGAPTWEARSVVQTDRFALPECSLFIAWLEEHPEPIYLHKLILEDGGFYMQACEPTQLKIKKGDCAYKFVIDLRKEKEVQIA